MSDEIVIKEITDKIELRENGEVWWGTERIFRIEAGKPVGNEPCYRAWFEAGDAGPKLRVSAGFSQSDWDYIEKYKK